MTRNDFPEILASEFPQIEEEVRENDGLVHMQMDDFARWMQRAIHAGDWPELKRCVHLADRVWQVGEPYLRNALAVFCLEHLTFPDPTGPRAFAMLTRELRETWEALDRLHATLAAPKRKRR